MSNIAKRHIQTQELLGEYLTFTPQPKQVNAFAVDMKTLHPTLLRDSIKEAVRTQKVQAIPANQQRAAIYKIYHRKIKEFSSLYPFLFAVENGLRSVLADHLETVFGRMDWWVIPRDARLNGQLPTNMLVIRAVPVKLRFVQLVWRAFDTMSNEATLNTSGNGKSDEFYYELTLGQLWKLIGADWPMMRPMFLPDAALGYRLMQRAFNDDMGIIKVGRDEIFHSNPIKNRAKFVAACERVLDLLAFHLEDYDEDMGKTQIARVKGNIPRGPRHIIPAR